MDESCGGAGANARRWWTPTPGVASDDTVVIVAGAYPLRPDFKGVTWLDDQPFKYYVMTRGLPFEYEDNFPSPNTGLGPETMIFHFIIRYFKSLPARMIFIGYEEPGEVRRSAPV